MLAVTSCMAGELSEPKVVTHIDLAESFDKLRTPIEKERLSTVEKAGYLIISAVPVGEVHTPSFDFHTALTLSMNPLGDDANKVILKANYLFSEGGSSPVLLDLKSPSELKIPANHAYLMRDDEKWFLYLIGTNSQSVGAEFSGQVFRIFLFFDVSNKSVSINLGSACSSTISDWPDSDCQNCSLREYQGKDSKKEQSASFDNIYKWVDEMTSEGPRLIRWSKNNYNCDIDFSKWVGK